MLSEKDVVKPGDEVAVYSGGGYGVYRIAKVAKVTPSGRIILTNGDKYNSSGRKMGEHSMWSSTSLSVLTDDIRAEITRAENLSIVKNVDWRNLDNAKLAQVVAVLKQKESEM